MLVIISPAKKIDETPLSIENFTQPIFLNESEKLINTLKKYSKKKLESLMHISKDLVSLNADRYQKWEVLHHEKNAKPAVFTFNGEVYNGLNIHSYHKKELEYAQHNLNILSGLYGLLNPLDLIQPYRLEMSTKLKVGRKNNLYQFWGDKITNEINQRLANQKDDILINLASTEYFKAVNTKKLKGKIITPVFKDFKNGEYKTIMMYAKKARGLMTSFILKNKINQIEDLKAFDEENYCFSNKLSKGNELVFKRG